MVADRLKDIHLYYETKKNNLSKNKKRKIQVNKEEFFELTEEGITIVDFFADWCAPCKAQGIVFDRLKKNNSIEGVKFLKFDLEKDDQSVANDLEIRNIPTIIIFNAGQEEFRFVGVTGKDTLIQGIKEVKKKEE